MHLGRENQNQSAAYLRDPSVQNQAEFWRLTWDGEGFWSFTFAEGGSLKSVSLTDKLGITNPSVSATFNQFKYSILSLK